VKNRKLEQTAQHQPLFAKTNADFCINKKQLIGDRALSNMHANP
jgi:hypothetical protein